MRRPVLIFVMTATLAAAAPRSAAADTLTGVLVDAACYRARGANAAGPAHANCAMACARKGHRIALVTSNGDVYLVIGALTQGDNAKLVPLMNRVVIAVGTLTQLEMKDGGVVDPLAPAPTATNGLDAPTAPDGISGTSAPKIDPGAIGDDGRRPPMQTSGVVTNHKARKGDFREGDVKDGIMPAIDLLSIDLAPGKIQ